MGCQDSDYVSILNAAQEASGDIGPERLAVLETAAEERGGDKAQVKLLNTRLYYVLIALTGNASFTIVGNDHTPMEWKPGTDYANAIRVLTNRSRSCQEWQSWQ